MKPGERPRSLRKRRELPTADPIALDACRSWELHERTGAELRPPDSLDAEERRYWWELIAEWIAQS